MSAATVTFKRTIGMARNLFSTAFSVGGFIALTSVIFVFNLDAITEGGLSVVTVWANSVALLLPVLAAFLAMDVWSDERQSGRIGALLSIAVRERDYTFGKFMGVWTMTMVVTLISLMFVLIEAMLFMPSALSSAHVGGIISALIILALQNALWSAISIATSAMFCHSAVAAGFSILLTAIIPRALWFALMAWSVDGATKFGEFPLDAHVIDFSSGMVSIGVVFTYLILTAIAVFVASKLVAMLRFVGSGAKMLRLSSLVSIALSLILGVLTVLLSMKVTLILDIPVEGITTAFSARTRGILAESNGEITITSFLSRSDVRFRNVGRFLRSLQHESASLGGARFNLNFVDPRWDFGASERLVRRGIMSDSIVYERGHRIVSMPVNDACDERIAAATIRRLTTLPQRCGIYWTVGHGERSYSAYGPYGMSDIARDLAREGYRNFSLDLASDSSIPGDCAMIVIAGAKDDFSRHELSKIEAYLREGGRMLVLLASPKQGGVVPILPSWGVRMEQRPITGALTFSGTDVIVSDFAQHVISDPLRGSRIVLERPIALSPSSAVGIGVGVDRIEFLPIASVNSTVVASSIERGVGVGSDIAVRPTRIVVVGDFTFALNGELSVRANANRDFLLNCAAYLSGTEISEYRERDHIGAMETLDRQGKIRLAIYSIGVMPSAVFILMLLLVFRRRCK